MTTDLTGLREGTTVREHELLNLLDRAEAGRHITRDTRGMMVDDLEAIGRELKATGFNKKHYDL